MNHEEIDKRLDKMIDEAEKELDIIFTKRMQAISAQLALMFKKYGDGATISRTEIYKYNRMQKELAAMAKEIDKDYKAVYASLLVLLQSQYIENYLQSGYIYELTADTPMEYVIPSIETINKVIANPIKELTLSNLMNNHRNEIIRKINIEIAQGIQAGESYSEMATRIEKAVGFSSRKARAVARTEGGRVQTISRLDSAEHAQQHANLVKVWNATLDNHVRTSHRVLDDQKADEKGYFHFRGHKAKGPRLFMVASLDINCRCTILFTVNGELPDLRRARNYEDASYQRKLADRIDKYMEQGKTLKQAEKRAMKEIKPPSVVVGYQSYQEWKKKLKTGDLNVAELLRKRGAR